MMFKSFFPTFMLVCLVGANSVQSANILFFFGFSGHSHRITVWPLVQALADRGHKVTFYSPFEPKKPTTHPNITEMVVQDIYDMAGFDFDPAEIRVKGGIQAIDAMWPGFIEMGVQLCEGLVNHKKTIEWAKTASFDLVFINALFNDCGYGLAHKFKAPTILYSTTSVFPWFGDVHGIPEENYPEFHYHLPLPEKMTFFEEVWNTYAALFWNYHRYKNYYPRVEATLRSSEFNIPDMPSILEMDQRNSLILFNSHFSEEFPRALPPNVIGIGGMHVSGKTQPVSKEIQTFIDKFEDGFVYFSFGTYVRLPTLPKSHHDAIFQAIKKFPKVGFVMKWNGGEQPKDIPKNVLLAEWLSQQDILAHPKIRAFISHGGLLSTQEAVYYAVPSIVFPVFAEQDYNAERIQGGERGIKMELFQLTEEKMDHALREILTNKKYKENQMQVSRIFKDRPAKPVETAVWWTEYVLRHKDTSFLQPIGLQRTWYEKRMLHIWGFIALIAIAASFFTFKILRFALCLLSGGKQDKTKVKKH